MKEIINTKIKFREPYRPFAPVTMVEKASEYFEVVNHKEAIDYIETLVQHKHYELTRDQIFKIHKIILQNIEDPGPDGAGIFIVGNLKIQERKTTEKQISRRQGNIDADLRRFDMILL